MRLPLVKLGALKSDVDFWPRPKSSKRETFGISLGHCSAFAYSLLRNCPAREAQLRGEEHVPPSGRWCPRVYFSVGSHSWQRPLCPCGRRGMHSLEVISGCPKGGTQGTGRFWASCICKTPGNSHLGLQSVRAEEHHARWELAGKGKRRLQSSSSAELTLLCFPSFPFDIKQAEWMKGRCRRN